jgi:hypothetical protein
MPRRILQALFAADAAVYLILPEQVVGITDMQQRRNAGGIQFIQLIDKADHLPEIVADAYFFNIIKVEAGQFREFIHQGIIYFHIANIAQFEVWNFLIFIRPASYFLPAGVQRLPSFTIFAVLWEEPEK